METLRDRQFSPDDHWEEVPCLFCGAGVASTPVWEDGANGSIVRCGGCGLLYRTPRWREASLVRHFQEEWTETMPVFYVEDYRTPNLQRLASWILTRFPQPGAILDIGCSYGNFLSQIPETWERFGIEPSHTACRLARQRISRGRFLCGTLGSVALPPQKFDVITLIDTIFYLPHPVSDLARLPAMLKPQGVLLLEASNAANRLPVYRWLDHQFPFSWMYFYTPRTLERLLREAGLEVVDRLDFPGHRLGSRSLAARLLTLGEFLAFRALRLLTGNRLDLVPHYVLVARKKT